MRLFFSFISIIFIIAFFGIGKQMYEDDNTINIYNYTSKFHWNESLFDDEIKEINISAPGQEINVIRLTNIIYRVVNTIGYITMEVAKWGIEVGFNKPQWDYFFFMKVLTYSLIVLIAIPLFSMLPFILAFIYLLWTWIKQAYRKVVDIFGD